MALIEFTWTKEKEYRACFRRLRRHSVSAATLCAGTGLEHVLLSPGYRQVLERPVLDLDPVQRQALYPLGVTFIESNALLSIAEGTVPGQLGNTLFLHQYQVPWIDHEGSEFNVETVFAWLGAVVLVATSKEFPLDEDYFVDRALFRAEVDHLVAQLRDYKKLSADGI